MFTKETRSIIKKLTGRITAVQRSRNKYIVIAIALTTMLIASVLSIGMSYQKSNEMQQIRLMGTTAHVAVTHPNPEQIKKLHTLSYVKTVGLQHNVGLVKNTPKMGDTTLSLHWYDKTEWQKFRVPANVDIVGSYPQKYNEVMVPLWVLHKMGIDHPQIGMEIPLGYYLGKDKRFPHNETFILSGYATEYLYIRSGNVGAVYVSDEFAKKSGNSVETNGAASVAYKDSKHIEKYNEQLAKDLSLLEGQKVKTVPMYDSSGTESRATALALVAVIVFIMFTGFLLIYNVFNISVSKDTRFYGLLKTIGTSPSQLKKIVMGQALRHAAIGIPMGLAVGAILSFAAVPMALSLFDLETGAEISFNPIIFLGAAFFALLTTITGAFKSANIAASISPVEALRFTGHQSRGKHKRSMGGGRPSRMAWRNIFRERKSAMVVLLSLTLGITTFMMITTLISSMNTDNYIASYVKNDFILKNNTLNSIGNASGTSEKQKFDSALLKRLKEIKGITNLRTTMMEKMSIKYDPGQFSKHVDWFCKKFGIKEKPTEQQLQDNFWGYIIGIDSRYIEELNKVSEKPIDVGAFKRGDIALIGTDNPDLYSNVGVMDVSVSSEGKSSKMALGGFVPWGFEYAGGGMAPNIYVSEEKLEKLAADPKIYKVNMDIEDGREKEALEEIKALTDDDHEISRTSRLEQQETMSDTKLMMYILGGGIALVLASIGILNFINVMATGVMARKIEFAILESVGMTKRQLRRMLMLEGLGYAGITTLCVGTLGSMATYRIFKLFQQQADYAIFTAPIIPLLVVMAAVFIICAITPGIVYKSFGSDSVVARLRETA